MGQLDKFKRRLIRSVAWMLIHQKIPEADVWKEMKKVMGCDCRQLWEHMKSLTQKKLRRLLVAEDKFTCIPDIARMSLTDWQLYDQVLVHEDLDVIGLHTMDPYKPDNKVLIDLFGLVQRFDVETKSGEELADAWTAATVYYNTQGHQCSPMLLQKRWYQLKFETRRRFYEYWHSYRGNEKMLTKAEQYRPTILQRTMARRFPEIIIEKFPDWETSIEESRIILPADFERRKNIKVLPQPNAENSPDIIVLEPNIETVDLLQDSDSDEENGQEDTDVNNDKDDNNPVTEVKVKVEPEDSDVDYTENEEPKKTDLAMAGVVAEETLFDNIDDDDIIELTAEEDSIKTIASSFEDGIINDECTAEENTDTDGSFIPKITNVFGNVNMTDETLSLIDNLTKTAPWPANVSESNEENNDDASNKAKEVSDGPVCLAIDIEDPIVDSDDKVEVINGNDLKETLITDVSPIILNTVSLKPNSGDAVLSRITENLISVKKDTNKTDNVDVRTLQFGNIDLSTFGEISEDVNFADDGIELVDDGVADIDQSIFKIKDGDNSGVTENNDVTRNSNESQEFKLDEKLFLDPVVYTKKLNDMCILKNKDVNTINVKTLLNKIILESKPISDRSVDAEKKRIERQRISPSSYMLQKPKNRKYNPIQLCKNPDFNTRLKRLTAGFLSSWQNRTLLKACKPLTIDLTKAFESKLINNTIYLKKPDNNRIIEIDEDEIKTTSVMPSIIPIQTLIDSTRLDDVLKLKSGYSSDSNSESEATVVERDKVIHPPDITKVRRINQPLVTAEVKPIQTENISNSLNSNDVNMKTEPDVSTNEDNLNAQTSKSEVAKESEEENTSTVGQKASLLAKMLVAPAPSPVFKKPIENTLNNRQNSITTELNRQKNQKKAATGPVKGVRPWRPSRPSWIKAFPYLEVKHDDFLLTIDTLHKMLHLFHGKNNKQSYSKLKNKQKKKVEKKKETKPPQKEKESKPKESNEPSKEKQTSKRTPRRVVTKVVYGNSLCCWAREQIAIHNNETRKRRRVHACLNADSCKCCCKDDLEKLIAVDKIRPDLIVPVTRWPNSVPQKDDLQNNVPDNTLSQAEHSQDTNVPTIAGVYSLNSSAVATSAVQEEISLNPNTSFASPELINEVIDQSLTSQKPDDESIDLNIPIYDETLLVKPKVMPKIIVSPTKNNYLELGIPIQDVSRVTKSLMSLGATSAVEHHKLNIPIIDETQLSKTLLKPQTTAAPVTPVAPVTSVGNNLNIPIRDDTKLVKPVITEVIEDDDVVDVTIKITKKPTPLLETYKGPAKLGKEDKKPKCTCSMKKTLNQRYNKPIVIDNIDKPIVQKNDDVKVTAESSNKDKVLILNSKQMMKIPVGCPIFLGTNKILLTDIKFPSSMEESSQSQTRNPIPQYPAPSLPLPQGVQLVLPHTGQLTYIMKSGFELSPEDKARMPALLQTVQMQMNSAGITSTTAATTTDGISNEVVDISDDEMSSTPKNDNNVISTPAATCDEQNNGNDSSLNSSLEEIEISQTNTLVEEISSNKVNDNVLTSQILQNITQLPSDNKECSKDTLNVSNKVVEQPNKESMVNPSTNSTGTVPILDTRTVIDANVNSEVKKSSSYDNVNEKNERAPSAKKTILSDLMEMSGISAEDALPVQVSPAKNECIPPLHPYIPGPSTSLPSPDNTLQLTHELNTVSSFAQLKYAYHNNGKFYKLDFDTGIVVPINVCLKKKPQSSTTSEIPIAPKETIDLTEDVEFSAVNDDTEKPADVREVLTNSPLVKLLKSKMHNVRPVTMFRTLQRPRILKQVDKNNLPNNLQIIKTPLGRSREVRLAYMSPTKPNVENNAPHVKQKRKYTPEATINLSPSESSDDEPLIKKVKRKRAQEAEPKSNFVFNLNKELDKHPNIARNLSKGPEDDPTALVEDDIRLFEDPPSEPFLMEDNDLIPDDAGEEDCILGV
ncbi:hypothetical protein O3G_MSEX010503 [Manduca sexta]|nr:hypothetical protein O3G_MSEX010503 [Manduca sexta]